MINVGKKLKKIGWVVSPVEASDLFQSRTKLSDGKLLSLANTITRYMDRPNDFAGRILDQAVRFASKQFADWEFREKIKEYQAQAMRRIQASGADFDLDEFDKETNNYLQGMGVNTQDVNNQDVDPSK